MEEFVVKVKRKCVKKEQTLTLRIVNSIVVGCSREESCWYRGDPKRCLLNRRIKIEG